MWNGTFDRRPTFIARCIDAADVSTILRYAADTDHRVTVRGGGHNVAGTSIADDAILIDLSLMRAVTVDADHRTAIAEGGCLLRDLDAATTVYGLACPAGVVSHTGLGGLALGGGYGWLARKWGLTCDHILGAEVVLGDGTIVETTQTNEPDLLWALRGGGGNFGVVTKFKLRLRPVSDMYLRRFLFPVNDAVAAIAAYQKFAPEQPRDLHVVATLKSSGNDNWIPSELYGRPALFLNALWLGNPEAGRSATEALVMTSQPVSTTESIIPYLTLQQLGDASEPAGNRYYTKSCYLSELSEDVATQLVVAARENPSQRSTIDFEYLRGAINETGSETSAFPNRDAPYICTASAQWLDSAADVENTDWARGTITRISGHHYRGVYINYIQDETAPAAVYEPQQYHRLAALKSRYDSSNIFRSNQNISPQRLSQRNGDR
ncbi:FAD-binding oxidoreductase [Nocardia terpenica]|nr:FAD-binding oxidoreductase [Nocardia terpenica]